MEKIQTAIQELISELKALKQTKVLMPSLNTIDDCINLAYAKIEVEKMQIVDSFEKGFLTTQWDKTKENKSEEYYKKTYKSE